MSLFLCLYVRIRLCCPHLCPLFQNDPSVAGKTRDMRPTIVFTTIEHPIMREWAQPGVDVEVFPSGLVLEQMESPAVCGSLL